VRSAEATGLAMGKLDSWSVFGAVGHCRRHFAELSQALAIASHPKGWITISDDDDIDKNLGTARHQRLCPGQRRVAVHRRSVVRSSRFPYMATSFFVDRLLDLGVIGYGGPT
jgi:hypothetical protein